MRILSVFLFLCLFSVNAWGQVSRALIQETVGERVELAMRDGDKVLGVVRTVSDSSVIMRDEEGRLRELRISDIREVKLLETPVVAPAAPAAPAAAPTPTSTRSTAPAAAPVPATSASEPSVSPATTRQERIARYQQQQASQQVLPPATRQSIYDPEPRHTRSAVPPASRGQHNFEKGTRLRNGGIALATIGTVVGSIGFALKSENREQCETVWDPDFGLYDDCEGKANTGMVIGSLGFITAGAGFPMAIAGGVRRGMGTRQLNDQLYRDRERRMSLAPTINPRTVGARFNLEF